MSALTIGGVYTAVLHGTAGPWTITGTATIWHADDNQLLVQIADHPDHRRRPAHTTYATGTLTVPADGPRQLVTLLTPQPGPSSITLGYTLQATRNPADAGHHREQAAALLAPWQPPAPGDGPLDVSALPWLERAAERVRDGRAAGGECAHLLRRLRAGGVDRNTLAAILQVDPTRISQLCRPGKP